MIADLIAHLSTDLKDGSREDLGTAIICSATVALTAFHCVGDRDLDQVIHNNVHLAIGDRTISGSVQECSSLHDFAILTLAEEVAHDNLPLRPIGADTTGMVFTSSGWAKGKSRDTPQSFANGSVHSEGLAQADGAAVLRLGIGDGDGLHRHQISGGPVLVRHPMDYRPVLAGIARWGDPMGNGVEQNELLAASMEHMIDNTLTLAEALGPSQFGFFVAYAEEDLGRAEWLCGRIEAIGARWAARFDYLRPGTDLDTEAIEALKMCPVVLVVLTASYLTSKDEDSRDERELIERVYRNPAFASTRHVAVQFEPAAMPTHLRKTKPIVLSAMEGNEEQVDSQVQVVLRRTFFEPRVLVGKAQRKEPNSIPRPLPKDAKPTAVLVDNERPPSEDLS